MDEHHAFFRELSPPPALQQMVESLWSYDDYRPPHLLERVLATDHSQILIPLEGQRLSWRELNGATGSCDGAVVMGPRSAPVDVSTAYQRGLMGIDVSPGAALLLLGVPVDSLAGRFVPLDALIGPRSRTLVDQLSSAPREIRLALAQQFLLERHAVARATSHPAVRFALTELARGDESISSLVSRTGLSHRRFLEIFRRAVGLVPRDVRRIRRLRSGIAARSTTPDGYFDQSHWILECKKLTGWSPRQLASAQSAAEAIPSRARGQLLPISGEPSAR